MSYPPPTLVPKTSRAAWIRRIVLVATLSLMLGTCVFTRLLHRGGKIQSASPAVADVPIESAPEAPVAQAPAPTVQPAPADTANQVAAVDGAPPAVQPAQPAGAVPQPGGDARQPNRWYYVPQIGEGPGVIYSRDGGRWSYAFACSLANRTIEFIAVGVGDPGGFDRQYLKVGGAKLMLDAGYAKDGGGTISAKLPAKHPFFDNFLGSDKSLELQMLPGSQVITPVGPDITRVIRECRG
jgi:hypothetical protein